MEGGKREKGKNKGKRREKGEKGGGKEGKKGKKGKSRVPIFIMHLLGNEPGHQLKISSKHRESIFFLYNII